MIILRIPKNHKYAVFLLLMGIAYFFAINPTYDNDPAKKTASVMLPFAWKHNFLFLSASSNAGAWTGTHPTHEYTYITSYTPREMRGMLSFYLENNGYEFYDHHDEYGEDGTYCDTPVFSTNICNTPLINDREQGWRFAAATKDGDSVEGVITNRTYKEAGWKEHPVPKGKSVLIITFRSHYCFDSATGRFYEKGEPDHPTLYPPCSQKAR